MSFARVIATFESVRVHLVDVLTASRQYEKGPRREKCVLELVRFVEGIGTLWTRERGERNKISHWPIMGEWPHDFVIDGH
jgi:hypothetical protein